MKIGTRAELDKNNAAVWGYKTPALGTVVGPDPMRRSIDIVSFKLDEESPSIYETRGVHIHRLMKFIEIEETGREAGE